jgi:hypothetical protein
MLYIENNDRAQRGGMRSSQSVSLKLNSLAFLGEGNVMQARPVLFKSCDAVRHGRAGLDFSSPDQEHRNRTDDFFDRLVLA